jgi:hypothetical protein
MGPQASPPGAWGLPIRFAIRDLGFYLQLMPGKSIELPPEVAKAFVLDMRAFHAEKSPIKRDEIASRQIHVLRQYQAKNERPIKLHQVKQMFEDMRDHT